MVEIVLDYQILVGYTIGKSGTSRASTRAPGPEKRGAAMHTKKMNTLAEMNSSLSTKSGIFCGRRCFVQIPY